MLTLLTSSNPPKALITLVGAYFFKQSKINNMPLHLQSIRFEFVTKDGACVEISYHANGLRSGSVKRPEYNVLASINGKIPTRLGIYRGLVNKTQTAKYVKMATNK